MNIDADREYLADLRRRRATVSLQAEKLAAKVAALDKAISGLAALIDDEPIEVGKTASRPEPSALWEHVRNVLQEQTDKAGMTVGEIAIVLTKRGVKIESATPGNIIFSAMSRKADVFVRMRRGVWALLADHPELVLDGVLA